MSSLFRDRRVQGDDGYALISVIGLGTAIVLSVGAVSAYSLQAMESAGSTQGFHASIQAAQAGVDYFVTKLNTAASPAEVTTAIADGTTPRAVPGAQDGDGATCTSVTGGSLPPNCPTFRYVATPTATGYEITSYGTSRGDTRAVKVSLKKRALTDYLYYSESEAADPADPFFYPTGTPAGCDAKEWTTPARPTSCTVLAWRDQDSTDGSRVHTRDYFRATGTPEFDSRVSVANPTCATSSSSCVRGGSPSYGNGSPGYADDLVMPGAEGLDLVRNAAAIVGGCTYYGPTRIKFEGDHMRVWSPQTPADPVGTPENRKCGGGVDATVLNQPVDVVVTAANRLGLCAIGVLVGPLICGALGVLGALLGTVKPVKLGDILSRSDILTGLGLSQALAGIAAPGNLVQIRPDMAIYVRDNPVGTATSAADPVNPPDPVGVQCLLATALGMYGSLDTNLTAGLLSATNTATPACRAGKFFIDGELDGRATIGVKGDVLIMSNVTYAGSDDRLGIVATGPIEVYNSMQCTLALNTCLTLQPLSTTVLNALNGVRTTLTTGNLTGLLQQVPGFLQDIEVDASLISLEHRVGVQLPLLSPSLSAALINQLIGLNIDPPTLTIKGSVAQKYRGVTSADLLSVHLGVAGIDVLGLTTDIGYSLNMEYDGKLATDPPKYLPGATASRWDQVSFAEIPA